MCWCLWFFCKFLSCINVYRKKFSSLISYSVLLLFLIMIFCSWLFGGIGVWIKLWCWVKKLFLLCKVVICWFFLVKYKFYLLFIGICEIICFIVLFVFLWMVGRINLFRWCWNMLRVFFWKVIVGKVRNFFF